MSKQPGTKVDIEEGKPLLNLWELVKFIKMLIAKKYRFNSIDVARNDMDDVTVLVKFKRVPVSEESDTTTTTKPDSEQPEEGTVKVLADTWNNYTEQAGSDVDIGNRSVKK